MDNEASKRVPSTMLVRVCSVISIVRRLLPFSWLLAAVIATPALAQAPAFPDFVELIEKVAPAVVNIRTLERPADAGRSPFRRSPAQPPGDDLPRGEGSGFIVSADGYVMTNAHVVEGASEVLVTLVDKREFMARIIGTDERSDVALLKIDATALPEVRIGDVSRLRVGEWVLAIGSPFGLDSTVTAGIVSAKQRETGADIAFLQTDVAVNPGNSGGPLINTRGEVIGINSQILSPVGSYIGISFAIPIDDAMHIADQLRTNGRVVRGYLGIQPTDLPRELAEAYGLAVGKGRTRGAFVRQVLPGAPGERAGIEPGDVVLEVDGKRVESAVDLRRRLGSAKPGTAVTLQINRKGKLLDVQAVLGEQGEQTVAASRSEAPLAEHGTSGVARPWGLVVANLSNAERQATNATGGVKVISVVAGAEAVGVRVGDVLTGVGGVEVGDVREFEEVLSTVDKTHALLVALRRGAVMLSLRIPVKQ
jgi:serine protease Do